ncbi:High-affinity branched-chain amino acid transport system permease protein LivH (TC 3.A.1.4.1) [Rhodococcus sp. RD6.2]|jgi:branched-chain amino acid transport system permease protein|uniref:branched-chain amino acid ABC transporter permease n=1 Tax=unclassified Rhodococcus (in: high G+C Gram-positive bacteria) TaxID=192944 RepID=UPI00063BC4C5|nr:MULTISPECIES: branched-chain amino acid ABC transporter permease [unclassified Rhodococcus (in: high G+C Gram-positive bacteria)]CRK53273.1 High-affinity branched-chain amino acid transport system permease protein LivH (TC 3.A.1.4.1) [Rhodococcus sp. RD6.2]
MQVFLQQLVDGLTWGALYGAFALSIVLVYRASGIVNFAQGEMAMFSAFFAWQFHQWGAPLYLAILGAMVVAFAGGAVTERVLIRPLASSPNHMPLVIITLGLMLVLNSAAGWIWGVQSKPFPTAVSGSVVTLGPVAISRQSLVIVAAVVVVAVLLFWLFQRTRTGLAMRAAAGNPDSAQLIGIPVGRMLTIGWGLAAAIGALAASLAAPQLLLQPNMLVASLIYAFAAAVLGGLDSPVGALIGGLIVGIAENLAGTYISWIGHDFKQAVALALILGVLLFKPEGLFGARKVVRV